MRNLVRTLGLCSLISLSGLVSAPITISAQETIKLGVVAPMSGPNARYGDFTLRGVRLAASQINEQGGIDGRQIEILPADSQGTPVESVSATRRLIDQAQVDYIIGDVSSSVTLAMQPVAEEAGVLLLNAASSNPKITYDSGVGGYQWTFRNYPTDENRALIIVKYAIEEMKINKFAVLAVDSDYGRSAIDFSKKYLGELGGELLSEDYYKEGEVDFRSVLAKIRASEAQAIIMYSLADTTPIIARQMVETGLAGKIPLIGNGEFNAQATIQSAPTAIEGAIEAAAWLPAWDSERSRDFVEAFIAANQGEQPNNHAYTHWETTYLLAAAIQQAGSTDREKVREALANIRYDSAMGEVTFDDHHQARLPMILLKIENGQPVIMGAYAADIDYSQQP